MTEPWSPQNRVQPKQSFLQVVLRYEIKLFCLQGFGWWKRMGIFKENEELSVCKVENFGPSRGETDMLKTEMVSSKVNLDKCRYQCVQIYTCSCHNIHQQFINFNNRFCPPPPPFIKPMQITTYKITVEFTKDRTVVGISSSYDDF